MAYTDPTITNVTLQTSAAAQEGFGVQLFLGIHAFFPERVRSYSSTTSALADFPSTSQEYIALSAAFSQSPPPAIVKVGRRNSTTVVTPLNVADTIEYTLDVTVNEGDKVQIAYTAGALDDEEAVVDALKLAIDGDAAVAAHVTATKVGVGAAAILNIIATTATDEYAVSNNNVNVSLTFTSIETGADTLAAIDLVDDDYAYVTASDHTEAFVLALAAYMSTQKKLYATSNQNEACLAALASPATDTVGKLFDLAYDNTISWYAIDADTTFPECAAGGKWLVTKPGTEAWHTKTIKGISEATAKNGGTTEVLLSQTQKDALVSRNANFVTKFKKLPMVEGGKTVGGEWVHVTRFAFFIEARSEEVMFTYMFNQSKVSHGKVGYVGLRSVLTSEWNNHIDADGNPQGLDADESYKFLEAPGASVTQADKVNGTFTDKAELYLAGAIKNVVLNLNLTYKV